MVPRLKRLRFARLLVQWRWLLLALAAVLAVCSYRPAQRLEFNRAIEKMFAADDPRLPSYRKLKRIFGSDEIVLAAYVDADLLAADGHGVARLDRLTKSLGEVPGVASTTSLSSTPFGHRIVQQPRLIEMMTNYLVGADRETAVVACELAAMEEGLSRSETIEEIRRVMGELEPEGVIAGEPVMVIDVYQFIRDDGDTLGTLSLVLLSATILICFRSLRWLVIPLCVVMLTLWATKAALFMSRVNLSMVSSMLSAIVIVVGVATVMHVIVRFRESRLLGYGPRRAAVRTIRLLAKPIFWACATDAVGFAALLFSGVGPVADFGLMMAVGALFVIISTALLVPGLALLGRFDMTPRRAFGEGKLDAGLDRLVAWVTNHPRPVIAGCLLLTILAAIGCLRLEVETDFTKNFRSNSRIVQSYEFVESRLGGAGVLDVLIPAPDKLDEAFVARLAKLQRRLEQEVVIENDDGSQSPGINKTLSLADSLEAFNIAGPTAMLAGRGVVPPKDLPNLPPRLKQLAQSQFAQLLFGGFGGLDQLPVETKLGALETAGLNFSSAFRGTDGDQSYVRVILRVRERQTAASKKRLLEEVTRISREEFSDAEISGYFVLLAGLVDSILRDQWITFSAAAVGIWLMMLVAFRSVRLSLVALIPNALPVLLVTGMMGLLGLKINMGAAMIAAVSLGLSIDSTVHYIAAFQRQRRHHATLESALAAVHQTVGRAVVFATAALVIGFTALCRSEFVPTAYFGALVSLSMLGALAGNLVVLPVLLRWVEPKEATA